MNMHTPDVLAGDVEQTEEARRRALESVARTFETLKRLIADYDGLKEERDKFEQQIASLVNENDALRDKVRRIDQERERCVQALAACATQISGLGDRCAEVARTAKAQASNSDGSAAAVRRDPLDRLGQRLDVDSPKMFKDPPEDFLSMGPKPRAGWDARTGNAEPRKAGAAESEPRKSAAESPDKAADEKSRALGSVTDRLSKILNDDKNRHD